MRCDIQYSRAFCGAARVMALGIAGLGLLSARAETRTWNNGAGNGKWSDQANWSGGALPEPGDAVVFDGAVSQAACAADRVTNNLASLTLLNGYTNRVVFAPRAVEGGSNLTVTAAIEVRSGHLVFAGDTTAVGDGTPTVKFGVGYTLQAATIAVSNGASINADGRGFPLRLGPGAGDTAGNGDYRGAGYGGEGAFRVASTGRGMPYGSAYAPTALGSGGGHTSSGPGGGALKLAVSGTITIDGRLSVDGGNGTAAWGYGGSGGSIWVASGTLRGGGVISANSGFCSIAWRGSGGGRIDLAGTINHFSGSLQVLGGDLNPSTTAFRRGMAGSIVLPQSAGTGWTRDTLVVTNELRLGNSQTFGAIIVTNGGALWLDANEGRDTFTFDTLDVHAASQVVFPGNRERVNAASGGTPSVPHGGGATATGTTIRVRSGGRIHADGSGFLRKMGPGSGFSSADYHGAGHGGLGGGSDAATYGLTYGAALAPTAIGSGGNNSVYGGAGGGAITLIATSNLTVNGSLTADGGNATARYGGGGSGGSLWIEAGGLTGNGTISARGGNYFIYTDKLSCSGGGGRILIRYAGEAGYTFTGTLTAAGGNAGAEAKKGADGSIVQQNTQAVNVRPNAPVSLHPGAGETLHAPYLRFSATDDDADFLRFKVEIATDSAFNDIVRTINQTVSQELWRGQTEQTYTAYLDNQPATVVIAPPLTPGATYYWRACATDPDGTDTWSDPSEPLSFTTFASAANWWVCDPNDIFGDRKWETAANWSSRSVPPPGEVIRFGGDYFNLDCTAASVSNHLASLTLATNYTKTVTFAANAVAGGMTLRLLGDLVVEGGALMLNGDTAAVGSGTPEVKHGRGYRIEAANVAIGSSGVMHADLAGFAYNQGPGAGTGAHQNDYGRGAGYGGRGGDGSNANLWYGGNPYGSETHPGALGSGGGHPYAREGGGAIWLVAENNITINGRLSADGGSASQVYASGASGGSLLLSAATVDGHGMIASRGGSATQGGGGGGGRISAVFGDEPGTRLAILDGGMERARIVAELTSFGGAFSVAPGTGYFNGPPQGAEAGSIVYIRALPPPGTILLLR